MVYCKSKRCEFHFQIQVSKCVTRKKVTQCTYVYIPYSVCFPCGVIIIWLVSNFEHNFHEYIGNQWAKIEHWRNWTKMISFKHNIYEIYILK